MPRKTQQGPTRCSDWGLSTEHHGDDFVVAPKKKRKSKPSSNTNPCAPKQGHVTPAKLHSSTPAFTTPPRNPSTVRKDEGAGSGGGSHAVFQLYTPDVMCVRVDPSVKVIDSQAFCGREQLEEVDLREGLEQTGWDAFSGCTYLKHITIPSIVKKDGRAFQVCQ
mmetsp:Transcript_12908/g.23259  ORF Transcript_12908/g.23259 Transcript_12908/m.23259 type:complete len:164 (-) Transcript_12908:177-668(-)|eukprot:CAMPEP_0201883350 /NCGR_PEP_ID=MMETSP0902-20130614/15462_1 /ASSEMBLY_ACC=CAM_ASM_000551 /TAXON_ID=420261 /ORGANISM="Thalassiosira antarctica, Strain CCMP982" /LENGTH=163 /DNA_ID=CAMNT_0048412113 /DNA_START=124 /DNA_END=615 /DNA_ORIENTATION=-